MLYSWKLNDNETLKLTNIDYLAWDMNFFLEHWHWNVWCVWYMGISRWQSTFIMYVHILIYGSDMVCLTKPFLKLLIQNFGELKIISGINSICVKIISCSLWYSVRQLVLSANIVYNYSFHCTCKDCMHIHFILLVR